MMLVTSLHCVNTNYATGLRRFEIKEGPGLKNIFLIIDFFSKILQNKEFFSEMSVSSKNVFTH